MVLALHVKDVPWAEKQMWAPDAAEKNGTYYLFFLQKIMMGFFGLVLQQAIRRLAHLVPQPTAIKKVFQLILQFLKMKMELLHVFRWHLGRTITTLENRTV